MKMSNAVSPLTRAFMARTLKAQDFGHREHLEVAYDLLRTRPFLDAANAYANGIQDIAATVGALDKYNTTITVVFLSVIAERLEADCCGAFDAFLKKNNDLLKPGLLEKWYAPEQINSPSARSIFLMPTP